MIVRENDTVVENKENTVVIKSLMSMAVDAVQRILDMEIKLKVTHMKGE